MFVFEIVTDGFGGKRITDIVEDESGDAREKFGVDKGGV